MTLLGIWLESLWLCSGRFPYWVRLPGQRVFLTQTSFRKIKFYLAGFRIQKDHLLNVLLMFSLVTNVSISLGPLLWLSPFASLSSLPWVLCTSSNYTPASFLLTSEKNEGRSLGKNMDFQWFWQERNKACWRQIHICILVLEGKLLKFKKWVLNECEIAAMKCLWCRSRPKSLM